MGTPTAPTATTLVTEAFYKTGIANPTSAQITRASSYFLEEVKHDIWTHKHPNGESVRFKSLQSVSVDITTVGISKMALPTDFDQEISISLLNGTHTGTAQAGASTTITLEDEEDAAEADVVGHYILITGGTGENELRQVSAYDTDTYIATITTAWGTNPSSDSTYRIIDSETELSPESIEETGNIGRSWSTGIPTLYSYVNEGVNRYIMFDKPPDASTYGIIFRYYANIHLIDTTEGSTIITAVYRDWRNALVYGVASKIAEDQDDSKYAVFKKEYLEEVGDLVAKELPYSDQFEGFIL